MQRRRAGSEELERPERRPTEPLADPDVAGDGEDESAGSEGTGRQIGLGETRRDRRPPDQPRRLPD